MPGLLSLRPNQNHLGFVLHEVWLSREIGGTSFQMGRGYSKFLDWDEFQMEFQKDFCPAHSDTMAINALESTSYFQKNALLMTI